MERNCEACKYHVTSEDGKTKGCSRWECKYENGYTAPNDMTFMFDGVTEVTDEIIEQIRQGK